MGISFKRAVHSARDVAADASASPPATGLGADELPIAPDDLPMTG
jgi:hypothetical protein